ncbi:RDD family protein [Wenzhouxiangella sediminis]|nr:RDD family protein [Wenzhouxiangella sediminis]
MVPGHLAPCGLLRRVASMVYDTLLVIALVMVAAAFVVIPAGSEIRSGTLWFQAYILVVWWAYFAVCWRLRAQTVGMRAWRVKLVARKGERVSWGATVVRFLVAWISAAALGLGFLWSLFEPRRRTWHDLASATGLVVIPKADKHRSSN